MSHSRASTFVGFALCLISLVLGQMAMSYWLMPGTMDGGRAESGSVVEDIGYTFTGLTAAIGFILWKWGKSQNISDQTGFQKWITKILQAIVASLPVVFGCLYFFIAGASVERHARTFAVLPPLMYALATITSSSSKLK